jgi:hypothetical protein
MIHIPEAVSRNATMIAKMYANGLFVPSLRMFTAGGK